jgi:hypothetical protein
LSTRYANSSRPCLPGSADARDRPSWSRSTGPQSRIVHAMYSRQRYRDAKVSPRFRQSA